MLLAMLSGVACGDEGRGRGGQAGHGGSGGTGGTTSSVAEVDIAGTPGTAGVFDPAPMSDDAGHMWMSYSAVRPSPHATTDAQLFQVRTRIASSGDAGATWSDSGADPNALADADLQVPDPDGGQRWATWRFEVSRLLFDPWDPEPARRWKLPWHRVIATAGATQGVPQFQTGWVGLTTAPDPSGPWSTEQKLVTGWGYDATIDAFLGPPEHPLHDELAGSDQLGGCGFFTEPGLLARPEGIYMSLVCLGAKNKLVLLRWDHAMSSVEYLGDLLEDEDAAAFSEAGEQYKGFSATELLETSQAVYLVVTPWVDPPQAYRGCLVFRVSDLASAGVEREDGVPVLVQRVSGVPGRFHGACGWSPSASASGMLLSQYEEGEPAAPYHMIATHVALP